VNAIAEQVTVTTIAPFNSVRAVTASAFLRWLSGGIHAVNAGRRRFTRRGKYG